MDELSNMIKEVLVQAGDADLKMNVKEKTQPKNEAVIIQDGKIYD